MARNAKSLANAAEMADKQRQCYELRLKGHTVRQVAEIVGVSKSSVSNYCKAAALEVISPLVSEYRQMEDERLDLAFAAILPRVEIGEVRAVEVLIKLLERRAKLHGLDAPVQVEQSITTYTETDRKLEELAREIFVERAPDSESV